MIDTIETAINEAQSAVAGNVEAQNESLVLRDLALRTRKLRRAWSRRQSVGLFGPSQAGKSFLVGALLSHELGSLKVMARDREVDFLKEINPAKGVESTGTVTRFTASVSAAHALRKGDFYCELLPLEGVLQSMATGFLVECTSPPLDVDRVERTLREARLQAGPQAPAIYARAWETVWLDLTKKYQDRHPYLNELRRHPAVRHGITDIQTTAGWILVYSLLWGGPGYAKDLDALMRTLVAGTEQLGHSEAVEVSLQHVRASSDAPSVIDASCLNALGTSRTVVMATTAELSPRDVALDPGVLAALIAEIRLPLKSVPGTLLDKADLLDFPGGRALKGINGFGPAELNTGKLENAIEVYKRGKLTFLFEQYSLDREITALLLCSPGPTKPEAIQLQSQVESWLQIRHGSATPKDPKEIESPGLFLALTKFDMSLGALRSDNAKDRWDSRVQEACIDFWARGHGSWILNWGSKGRAFNNLFWIRNPYADQMQALKPGDPDYEVVKQGYLASRAVGTFIQSPEEKWLAVEGLEPSGLPKSGVPLLASHLRTKMNEDIKAKELAQEARAIRSELLSVLKALTPSRDEAEERARKLEEAKQLVSAVEAEMSRHCTGAVFGEFVDLVVAPEQDVEVEVRKVLDVVMPMSIKASDKVKKVLVHVLKWWAKLAADRLRSSELAIPQAQAENFVREVCTSKLLLPVLGNAVFPYFARTQVDAALVATILRVKISDAMLGLLLPESRKTPDAPVRLSYAEDSSESAANVDWSNVSFEDEPTQEPGKGVSIVFAGNRFFSRWSAGLGDFYLRSGGSRSAAIEDARVKLLGDVLRRVEQVDVPA
ncbi:MAG: hypothetical protein JST00_11525 [Deltaproteobacteria bacterium]|nr:hypothetical protein [Deltaproteobacteria bacterium]